MTKIKILFLALLSTITMSAQKQFTLEDLNFGGTNFHQMRPENRFSAWWGDELVGTDVENCYIINKENGNKSHLFSLDDINSWAGLSGETGEISSLSYATFPYPDKSLVFVKNSNARFLIDFRAHRKVWEQSCKGETVGDWSRESRATAAVMSDNLYVIDGKGGVKQITTDGSKDIVYGQSVHRDEFGIYKGTFWNKKGDKLAFYRMDQSMVADYPLVDIDTRISTETPIKYPMAGEKSHKVTVGVYDIKTGKTVYLDAGDPTDRYFTNIAWSPDGKTIYMIELNRDQTDMILTHYDAESGKKIGSIYQEHDDKYVQPKNPIVFLPWDDDKFIMRSQKDGYDHLYLFNTKGNQLKQLTSGKWVVMDLLGFDSKTKDAIILSREKSAIQVNVYAVNIESGKRRLLDNGRGYHCMDAEASSHHTLNLSSSGQYVWDNFSEPNVPRQINIINTESAKNTVYLKAADPWKDYNVLDITCGTIKAADNKTDLYYRMVKPVGFDSNKKYPTIVYVYGGPGERLIDATWHYDMRGWEAYMAQKGYLLFILDNRGSSDRGRDFEQVTFRHLGVEEMKDQIKGVEFLKSLDYVDSTRMGVHGWSFGGFMTTSLMTTYPDLFKVGVAGGPVIDWKWYEVMYGERYMDTPQTNPEGYAETSLLHKAKNLKGKLQIIIGLNDPVVVPQHALSFIKECIAGGTQPDFFVYPGEPHNMRGHQSVHLHERISQYFDDYLK